MKYSGSEMVIDSTPPREFNQLYRGYLEGAVVDTTFLPKWGGYSDAIRKDWVRIVKLPRCHHHKYRCRSIDSDGLVANGCKREKLA